MLSSVVYTEHNFIANGFLTAIPCLCCWRSIADRQVIKNSSNETGQAARRADFELKREDICVWLFSGHLKQQNEQLIYKQIYGEKTDLSHHIFQGCLMRHSSIPGLAANQGSSQPEGDSWGILKLGLGTVLWLAPDTNVTLMFSSSINTVRTEKHQLSPFLILI